MAPWSAAPQFTHEPFKPDPGLSSWMGQSGTSVAATQPWPQDQSWSASNGDLTHPVPFSHPALSSQLDNALHKQHAAAGTNGVESGDDMDDGGFGHFAAADHASPHGHDPGEAVQQDQAPAADRFVPVHTAPCIKCCQACTLVTFITACHHAEHLLSGMSAH